MINVHELLNISSIDVYSASEEELENWILQCDFLLDEEDEDEEDLEVIQNLLELCEDELTARGR